ncbi:unnamed protein product [Pneumocystis jirovecii]|uniref:PHD-type domain-containing protein n=1 Tax=Pneumocystis jirovecii TaxID=42068 RepID=L0PF01_PNEJI|nr:unnamed protein product [Pneumocystis jirovecii]
MPFTGAMANIIRTKKTRTLRFEIKDKEIDALNLETKGCKNCNPEKNTLQSHQKRLEEHFFSDISRIKREKIESFYQNQSAYQSYILPEEFKYSERTSENIINSKTYCKICHKEYNVSSGNFFLCSNCKSYYHQSCHDNLISDISEKNDMQWDCFKCRVKECIKKDKDALRFFGETFSR